MTAHSPPLSPRRAVLALCLALAIAVLTVPARADDLPKFSNPAVTEYCRQLAAAVDRVVAAEKAKDDAKTMAALSAMVDLQTKNVGDVSRQLQASEIGAYADFLQAQNKRIDDAK